MATINFLYRSKRAKAPLTIRLLYNSSQLAAKSKIFVEKDYFLNKHFKGTKDAEIKKKQNQLNNELQKIENHILDLFNKTPINEIDKEWLVEQVDLYYNPNKNSPFEDYVSYWIKKYANDASTMENRQGGIGLSKSRIDQYNNLNTLFEEWQGKKRIKVKELDKNKFRSFKIWLLNDKEYQPNYSLKKLSDLRTVCKYARSFNIETSTDLDFISIKQVSAYDSDMDIIALDKAELDRIEKLELKDDRLINARKWLILMCWTGQRGKKFTQNLTENSFKVRDGYFVIEINQKKGNKPTIIPVFKQVKNIYESGLPKPVTTQSLNADFKIIGEKAKINTPTLGKLEVTTTINEEKVRRKVKAIRPKYEYMATHIGRRTFANLMFYEKVARGAVMKITNHSRESTYLQYIRKSDDAHIEAFQSHFSDHNESLNSPLRIVRTGTDSQ
tara:strand:+ start:43653 stop:44981 length:1329 start_codon:yes stop_codon:yes gene_type:complete